MLNRLSWGLVEAESARSFAVFLGRWIRTTMLGGTMRVVQAGWIALTR